MGTTLANLHILNGDEQQLRAMLPTATVGWWSARFVSAYLTFDPGFNEKAAKALSKKLSRTVLFAWLFDSDAVGFVVYQSGRQIAAHTMSPDGYSKMGNIALFCETLGLPAEDVSRLRTVWKKGDAEEQLELTAMLLGLPLYHDHDMLPDKMHARNTEAVDKWIAERPVPPRVKNETTVRLIQEIPRFRWNFTHGSTQYCGAEPYDDDHAFSSCQFWTPDADGMLQSGWSTEDDLFYQPSGDRVLGFDTPGGTVVFDSAGMLPDDYRAKGSVQFALPDGDLLWISGRQHIEGPMTLIRCAKDGSELWRRSENRQGFYFWGCENGEIVFTYDTAEAWSLERVDALTGAVIEILQRPFGLNDWSKEYNAGYWWVAHDGRMLKDAKQTERGDTLSKLDGALRVVAEISADVYAGTFLLAG